MQIPSKIQHGEKVISTVFEKINGIIDYLNASKLRKSSGIDVRETPSGTVLELVQKSASAPQSQQSTAVASGLEATVSGGTATVGISGSTSSVEFVGAGGVTISGNTNGQVEINASGIPFPVFPSYNIPLNGTSHVMTSNGWVVMTAEIESNGNSGYPGYAFLRVINNGTATDHLVCCNGFLIVEGIAAGSFSFPVVSGSTVTAYLDMGSNYSLSANVQANKILIYE